MIRILIKWLLSALALILVAYLVPGIHIGHLTAIIAALVIGLINAILRPILVILTLPLTIVTLGLFLIILNGFLFWLAAALVPNFSIHGLFAVVIGSLLYGLLGWVINLAVHRIGD